MSSLAITIFWIICGAGFVYYPGIFVTAVMSITTRDDKPRSRLKFGIRRIINPRVLFAIAYPLTYILSLKMSYAAFEDNLVIEAYLSMIPSLVFTAAFLVRIRKRRQKQKNYGL